MPSDNYSNPAIEVSTSGQLPSSSDDPYAPTSWGAPTEFDFVTPSGQRCRMRKIDVIELMETNLLNSVDFLTGTVEKKAMPQNRAERRAAQRSDSAEPTLTQEESAQKVLDSFKSDPAKSKEFMKVLDEVVCMAVVRPEVHPMPSEGSPLVPGRIYVKSIDFNDRIAIFNKAMEGVTKLQQFRDEAEEPQRAVENVEGL